MIHARSSSASPACDHTDGHHFRSVAASSSNLRGRQAFLPFDQLVVCRWSSQSRQRCWNGLVSIDTGLALLKIHGLQSTQAWSSPSQDCRWEPRTPSTATCRHLATWKLHGFRIANSSTPSCQTSAKMSVRSLKLDCHSTRADRTSWNKVTSRCAMALENVPTLDAICFPRSPRSRGGLLGYPR